VQCAACQHDNSASARFCEACGAALARRCGACGATLAPAARFCSQCGALAAAQQNAAGPAPALLPTREAPVGERRQLTALFCDVVGSTELSQRIDAEELRELIAAYQRVCADVVRRYDGHVAQLLGDGVLVYFGFPRAHEDDAVRALRAALEIQAGLRQLSAKRADARASEIRARIGVHTGPVVLSTLGSDARQETLALGDTVNIASRLDALAEPGGIVASDATVRLAGGLFVTRDLGMLALKGVVEPLHAHAIERIAGVSARDAGAPATPLIGREREIGLLLDRWEDVREGRGQVAVVSGEPGLGKSRLLRALRERIASTPHSELDLYCSPFATGSAFQPAIELFERGFGFAEGESREARLAKLERGLPQVIGEDLSEVLPYLASLLGLPVPAQYPPPHVSPEVQREKTLAALLAPTLALERLQPLVIFAEDLHWSDPSTLDLIGRLIDQAPALRLLVVVTHRPSFTPPWPLARSYVSPLSLTRLGSRATRALIEARAGLELPERVLDDIANRADGVPLFAEELVRSLLDSGVVVASGGRYALRGSLAIPTSLHGSLMARLDRLPAAKPVAQIGATLGREFSHALIEAVADVSPAEIARGLDELVAAEILYRRGVAPDAAYTFKHALLQDTAYESQLRSRRRELHARVAAVLAQKFPSRVAAEPQVVAHHCAEGGLIPQAIEHYALAAQQSIARAANPEAVDYYERALAHLASLPESPERAQQELQLRLALARPIEPRGRDHPDVVANFERVAALCDALEPGPARLPALVGLAALHQARADLWRSSRYARELLAIAEALRIEPLQLAAHAMLGAAATSCVDVAAACDHFERMHELAARVSPPPPSAAFDVDIAAAFSAMHATGLVLAGRPDHALAQIAQGLERARAIGHVYTLSLALATASNAAQFLEDAELTRAIAEECLAVLAGRGFLQLEANAVALGGWARVMLGDASGEEQLDRGIALLSDAGAGAGIVQLHVAASEAARRLGKLDAARGHADHVRRWCDEFAIPNFAPNADTLHGELLIASGGDLDAAERALLQTIEAWRRFRSPWMELRSAIALGELALLRGDRAAARVRIEAIYARFTEGFETPRLREARRLMAALAAPA
jgi:class 3 adenylate cyclase/tetratricopeptide (TPR) repeat protein